MQCAAHVTPQAHGCALKTLQGIEVSAIPSKVEQENDSFIQKHMQLTQGKILCTSIRHDRGQHHEKTVTLGIVDDGFIQFEFRTLGSKIHILDRQFMHIKQALHLFKHRRAGLAQFQPQKPIDSRQDIRNLRRCALHALAFV